MGGGGGAVKDLPGVGRGRGTCRWGSGSGDVGGRQLRSWLRNLGRSACVLKCIIAWESSICVVVAGIVAPNGGETSV